MKHFKGYSSIYQVKDQQGRVMPKDEVIERGIAKPGKAAPGFDLGPNEIPLGCNLQLDNFRQYMAYAMTFRNPVGNYVLQRFGVGTGTTPPTTADAQLQNQVALISPDQPGLGTKLIDFVNYPSPYVSQIYFTLGTTDALGTLITEVGLFTGDNTLVVRWLIPGINQSGTNSIQFVHRLVW